MMLIRWIVLLTLSLFISGCGVLIDFFSSTDDAPPIERGLEPPDLALLRGDIAFPMDRGSYCWETGEAGLCVDVFPPSYTAEMHTLVIGSTLELVFDAPFPTTVSASLHPGSNLATRIADIMAEAQLDENGRVLVTVPADLEGDYVLMIFANWVEDDTQRGDAFYTTPVRFDP